MEHPPDPTQPHASSSKIPLSNPQLGPSPFFAFPIPSGLDVDDEIPPYDESENVPLGALLDRVARKGYGDMRVLVNQTLPPLNPRQKPRHIIEYAKTTRQSLLKYLAVLRWHAAVDVPAVIPPPPAGPAQPILNGVTSFPTPHSNEGSNTTSPAAFPGKGKGRAIEEDAQPVIRGKVTDAKRIEHFMKHQNLQHDLAVGHAKHAGAQIESLRLRNPDILTALDLLTLGTFPRLPTSLTETFVPRPPLTNAAILDTLRRLNAHIRYRLPCVDYLPPDIVVRKIENGRAYLAGGGEHVWRAECTLVGFGEGEKGNWWLTGVEWGWRRKRGTDDPGGDGEKRFTGEERQQILDVANGELLPARPVPGDAKEAAALADGETAPGSTQMVDAPLVRLSNFLQHLSLSYQLEVLFSQAMALANGAKWRNQLLVNIDRKEKVLRLRYWVRPRPPPAPVPTGPAIKKPPAPTPSSREPLVGATIRISLEENPAPTTASDRMLSDIEGVAGTPSERAVPLRLGLKWDIGEAGAGSSLKVGEAMDTSALQLNADSLSVDDIVVTATRIHAAHLTRAISAALLSSPRVNLFPSLKPTLVETDDADQPIFVKIPLPSRHAASSLEVSVSPSTGVINIEDTGLEDAFGGGERANRIKIATGNVREGKAKVADDVARLILSTLVEDLEIQMKQLGWTTARRLPLRSQEMVKADLMPATSIFVTLPSSSLHYFVARIGPQGMIFELLRLTRVQAENGMGMKLAIGDRMPLDLATLRQRGKERAEARREAAQAAGQVLEDRGGQAETASAFDVDPQDLKDLFLFANAMVAQTIIEQQLKDRAIPYTYYYPPTTGPAAPRSDSRVAGMVPNLVVKSADLLKDGGAADVAMPKVHMRIRGWWNGGKCGVETIMQLRHRPSVGDPGASPAATTSGARQSTGAKAEGITFDVATGTVKFEAPDITKCVPALLEQWERLSKVMVVVASINRLNKHSEFKDLRQLSFDLRTVTIAYSHAFVASITYNPQSDSYVANFGKLGGPSSVTGVSPAASMDPRIGGATGLTPLNAPTPAAPTPHTNGPTPVPAGLTPGAGFTPAGFTPSMISQSAQGDNPHLSMAGLLSYRLNELVAEGTGHAGKDFIMLLRATLPFLLELEVIRGSSDSPALVIRSVSDYRLVWDHKCHRYAIGVSLLPNNRSFLFVDASVPVRGKIDPSCGPLAAIPNWDKAVAAAWDGVRASHREGIKSSPVAVEKGAALDKDKEGKKPLAMKLDGGKSLVCEAKVVATVVRLLASEVEGAVSG